MIVRHYRWPCGPYEALARSGPVATLSDVDRWLAIAPRSNRAGAIAVRSRSMLSTPQAGTVPEDLLGEIVRRVVSFASPEKIVLFGSAARGTMGPNSDLDLLVILPGPVDRLKAMAEIRRAIGRVGVAIDVVVATSEDVEKYRDVHCMVFKPALAEGRVLYGA